jgi:hypothetical protein
LTDLINEYPSPLDFATRELNYRDGARAQTILGVARYLMDAQRGRDGCTEHERITSWAAAVKPSDSGSVGVHGSGLPGFQYLRMLFGVQTCKPDIYIVRFVRDVVGRKVDDRTALQLLEAAAQRARLPLREVDNVIWSEGRKRPSRCGTKGEFKT